MEDIHHKTGLNTDDAIRLGGKSSDSDAAAAGFAHQELAYGQAERATKTRLLIPAVGSLVATNLLEALAVIGRERFFVIGTNSNAEAALGTKDI